MNEIHVWQGDLDELSRQRPHLHRHLSEREWARAQQFLRARDRQRFIAGRGQLREILARCVGVPTARLEIETHRWGKPFLPAFGEWHFNGTHSENWALWAVARGRAIGVDIERVCPFKCPTRLFCAREMERWPAPNDAQFFQLWTRKEAYLKAEGRGLSVALNEVDASDFDGPMLRWDALISDWRPDEKWRVGALETFPDCVAALAAPGDDWTVVRHEL